MIEVENAKRELIEHIKDRQVEFIKIAFRQNYTDDPTRIEGTLDDVLPKLDFNYDDCYGGQKLFGFIWYANGTWSDRGEYDGSEWWQHQECPPRDIEVNV